MRRESVKVLLDFYLPSSFEKHPSMRRTVYAFLIAGLLAAPLLLPTPVLAQSKPEDTQPNPAAQQKPQIPAMKKKGTEPVPPSRRAECAWTGQRIVSLLWRDDVNTAREQSRFYELFGCPANHLPLAFRCVIEQSQTQPDQNDLNARVYSCWMEPEQRDTQE
jgi:hypothetical protein